MFNLCPESEFSNKRDWSSEPAVTPGILDTFCKLKKNKAFNCLSVLCSYNKLDFEKIKPFTVLSHLEILSSVVSFSKLLRL